MCHCLCSSDSEWGSQCDQLVCPTALAACTRVDSCFAPWFVPAVGISIRLAYLELRFCHNLDQLGTGVCVCDAQKITKVLFVETSVSADSLL